MPVEGFSYDEQQDLWIADGSPDLGWSDGSEAYLLQVFEDAETIDDYPIALARRFIRDWPSRYHLSHLRVNLLEAIRPCSILLGGLWRSAVEQASSPNGSPRRSLK